MISKDICKKCGKCCYIKVVIGGIPFFSKNHCKFLDTDTNLCTIYNDRYKKNPSCLTAEEALRIKALPNECPYTKKEKGYEGPIWPKDD